MNSELLILSDVVEIMEEYAPAELALEYDNVGLLLGKRSQKIHTILVALDLTDETANEAEDLHADLIITHHPFIFSSIKKITDETSLGRRIMRLIENRTAVIAAHTNLDIAAGGTNDTLFDAFGLTNKEDLNDGLGRAGFTAKALTLSGFSELVKNRLHLAEVHVAGESSRVIRKVGLCTGSAADAKYIRAAAAQGCDVYVTGDVTYHDAQVAVEEGIALIDATHFSTEVIIVPQICEYLNRALLARGKTANILQSATDAGFFYTL